MKVEQQKGNVNPFGGLNFIIQHLYQAGIPQLIDSQLGKRKGYYQYSDIFCNLLSIYFSGGNALEELQDHLAPYLKQVQGFHVCSADTLGRGISELAGDDQYYTSRQGISHKFNQATGLNQLNIRMLRRLGIIGGKRAHTLDYDNEVIECEKYDAAKTYKHCYGYQPGVAAIGRYIIYTEGRNGNSQARYRQDETLGRIFRALNQEGVDITYSRMDSASYQKEVVDVVESNTRWFYIRANRCQDLQQQVRGLANWQEARINNQFCQLNTLETYQPFNGSKTYRLIISRQPRSDGQGDLFSGDSYIYRAILTNDYKSSPRAIVEFYNQRGASERNHDELNNDFGWGRLPFSFLAQNTAFMVMTAMCKNLFHFLMEQYSRCLDWLQPHYRMKKLIFRFISVPACWVKRARTQVLKIYSPKDYKPDKLNALFHKA